MISFYNKKITIKKIIDSMLIIKIINNKQKIKDIY
jgi:hypothetical protein